MQQLKKIIDSNDAFSSEQILEIFNLVGENGDIILLKNDGLRDSRRFTVVIIHSGESIRIDDETLNSALKKSVNKYLGLISR